MYIVGPTLSSEHSTHSDKYWERTRYVLDKSDLSTYAQLFPRKVDRLIAGKKVLRDWVTAGSPLPLPYVFRKATQRTVTGEPVSNALSYVGGLFETRHAPSVYNSAYEKFVNQLRSTASLGVAVAEYKQTVDLLVSTLRSVRTVFGLLQGRATTDEVLRIIRELRKNPNHRVKVRRVVPPPPPGLVKDKDRWIADRYLAVQFGVLPLIQDVHDVLEVFDNPQVTPAVFGRSKETRSKSVHPPSGWHTVETLKISYHLQANVTIESPAIHKMAQLGVYNPAEVLWETIPFSFVVDWFGNVGNYIRSFSDFVGLDLTRQFVSEKRELTLEAFYDEGPPWGVTHHHVFQGTSLTRRPGAISGPTLEFRGLRLTMGQALSAIALVVQFSPKSRS